jgi:hypothetical protein
MPMAGCGSTRYRVPCVQDYDSRAGQIPDNLCLSLAIRLPLSCELVFTVGALMKQLPEGNEGGYVQTPNPDHPSAQWCS